MTEHDIDDLDEAPGACADWDAFYEEEGPEPERDGMPFRMYGREWRLPSSLPGLFELQMHRVRQSTNPDDITALLAVLFGTELVDEMLRRNISDRRFSIALMWATANAKKPGSMSMARAAEMHDEADREGKAPRPRPAKKRKKRPSSTTRP